MITSCIADGTENAPQLLPRWCRRGPGSAYNTHHHPSIIKTPTHKNKSLLYLYYTIIILYNIIIIIKKYYNNKKIASSSSYYDATCFTRTRQREHVEQGAHSLVVYSRLGCGLNTHGAMTSVVEAQDSDGGMNDVDHSMHFTLPTYRANATIHTSLRNVKKEREQNRLFRVKSIYHDYLYLESILRDLQIKKSVSNETSSENSCNYDLHNCNIKVYANLRNGLWYYPSFDGTSYFKSTDGHSYKWNFSYKRLNLNVAKAAISTMALSWWIVPDGAKHFQTRSQ